MTDSEDITADEQQRFGRYIQRYRQGEVIIREGQTDRTLYLLRAGELGVYKNASGRQRKVGVIKALNIFGEIALVTAGPRSATIKVTSPSAVIYKFDAFNLKEIYANPVWSELLITRLCSNLQETNGQIAELSDRLVETSGRNQDLVAQTGLLLSAWIGLQAVLAPEADQNSKEWLFLNALKEMTVAFVQRVMPEVHAHTSPEGSDGAIQNIIEQGLMPEAIDQIIQHLRDS